jgi:hypothetical protein
LIALGLLVMWSIWVDTKWKTAATILVYDFWILKPQKVRWEFLGPEQRRNSLKHADPEEPPGYLSFRLLDFPSQSHQAIEAEKWT